MSKLEVECLKYGEGDDFEFFLFSDVGMSGQSANGEGDTFGVGKEPLISINLIDQEPYINAELCKGNEKPLRMYCTLNGYTLVRIGMYYDFYEAGEEVS